MARRTVRQSQFVPSGYSYGNDGKQEDYGVFFLLPMLGLSYAAQKTGEAASEKMFGTEEEPTALGIMKKYWWAVLLGLPVAYVVINKGLDLMEPKEKK